MKKNNHKKILKNSNKKIKRNRQIQRLAKALKSNIAKRKLHKSDII